MFIVNPVSQNTINRIIFTFMVLSSCFMLVNEALLDSFLQYYRFPWSQRALWKDIIDFSLNLRRWKKRLITIGSIDHDITTNCCNILGLDSEAFCCQAQGVMKVTGIPFIYFDELFVKFIIFTVFEIAWFSHNYSWPEFITFISKQISKAMVFGKCR